MAWTHAAKNEKNSFNVHRSPFTVLELLEINFIILNPEAFQFIVRFRFYLVFKYHPYIFQLSGYSLLCPLLCSFFYKFFLFCYIFHNLFSTSPSRFFERWLHFGLAVLQTEHFGIHFMTYEKFLRSDMSFTFFFVRFTLGNIPEWKDTDISAETKKKYQIKNTQKFNMFGILLEIRNRE